MKLETYLQAKRLSPADFASKIDVSAVSVTRYLAGTRLPRPEIQTRIAQVTEGQVTPNDFVLSQPEQAA